MKIAFLSDIHANFPALCAALECAERLGAEGVVCAGDLVGGGPHPTEVIRLLMERRIPAILGNVDRKVLRLASSPKKRKEAMKGKRAPLAWTAKAMGGPELRWLQGLPAELRLVFGAAAIRVVHGSPLSDTDYIYPSLTPEALAVKLGDDRPSVLVCGHSHIPFTKRVSGVLVVNCGSAGRPVDGDPRGSFVLGDFPGGGRATARTVRFAYALNAVTDDLANRNVPGAAPEEIRRGTRG